MNFFRVGHELYLADLPGYGYAKVPEAVRQGWERLVTSYLEDARRWRSACSWWTRATSRGRATRRCGRAWSTDGCPTCWPPPRRTSWAAASGRGACARCARGLGPRATRRRRRERGATGRESTPCGPRSGARRGRREERDGTGGMTAGESQAAGDRTAGARSGPGSAADRGARGAAARAAAQAPAARGRPQDPRPLRAQGDEHPGPQRHGPRAGRRRRGGDEEARPHLQDPAEPDREERPPLRGGRAGDACPTATASCARRSRTTCPGPTTSTSRPRRSASSTCAPATP